MRRALLVSFMAISVLSTPPAIAEDGKTFVAGVDPSKRPENAPVITSFDKDGEWYSRALEGVSKPYPYSLRFLEDQGRWFTPFNKPGMTGPYDIRGWH